MGGLALGLVLGSALLHALWNLVLKERSQRVSFSLAALLCGLAVFALPCAALVRGAGLPVAALPWAAASGLVHVFYFYALSRAYETGDLSFAYPVSRGGAALLVPPLAWLLEAERPNAVGAAGIGLIVLGLAVLQRTGRGQRVPRSALLWAGATGVTIAAYSLIDQVGVRHAPPLLYWWCAAAVCAVGLALLLRAGGRLGELRTLGADWRWAAAVGTMLFVTYSLVLSALRLAPVLYVYPARQASLAFGVLLGSLVRREPASGRRLLGALVIALGTVLLGAA